MPARSVLCLLLLATACASQGAKELAEAQASRNQTTTSRIRLEGFVVGFSNRIERACDEIAQGTDDPQIRRNTVYFKLRAIPLARRSLDRADDQAVMMDLWLYSVAVREFAKSDRAQEYFEGDSAVMGEAGSELEEAARVLARELMEPEQFQSAEKGIEQFVADHLIEKDLRVSEKDQDDWGKVVTESLGKPLSIVSRPLSALNFTAGISDTAVAVHQLTAEASRARTTVEYMPTDIRWQTQLLMMDLEDNLDTTSLVESVAKVSDSSVRLAETAETLPAELRAELTSFVDDVDTMQANLQTTLQGVDTLMASADATARTLVDTGDSLTRTLEAFDAAMITILGPPLDPDAPPPPPKDPAEKTQPFDINDYGATAEKLTETATALTALLAEAKALQESPASPALIEDTEAMARNIVNQVFLSAGLFVLFTALVMLSYRLVSGRLRDSRSTG